MAGGEMQNTTPDVSNAEAGGNHEVTALARRSGGPRTLVGKQRSRDNARKHGLLSAVAVLPNESRKDFEALLEGLRSYFLPDGEVEELLVEQLATTLWRKRRFLVAEAAEIRKNQEFLEWEREQRQLAEAEEQMRKTVEGDPSADFPGLPPGKEGLIWQPENPEILKRCLELLDELREDFRSQGFSSDMAKSTLETLYGEDHGGHLRETLKDEFAAWHRRAQVSEEEREQNGYATPEGCEENLLKAIDAEIARLKRLQKEQLERETRRVEVEKLRLSIPEGPGLDKLIRYEAALDRSFDRTLGQLERLQRMRLGQPVPPPVKLEVTRI